MSEAGSWGHPRKPVWLAPMAFPDGVKPLSPGVPDASVIVGGGSTTSPGYHIHAEHFSSCTVEWSPGTCPQHALQSPGGYIQPDGHIGLWVPPTHPLRV